jgi:hypothetical protein
MSPEFKERMIASLPIEGWCTEAKAEVLCDTLFLHAPSVCVEIGVFGGRSLVPQALALKELGGPRHILGIDPWKLDAALEGDIGKDNEKWWTENVNLESIYRGFVESVLKNDLTDYCRWFRGRSEQAVRLFDDKSVDWLHQDSNHSEMVSCRDVDLWAPKMAKKSVWIMDDSDWPSQAKAIAKIRNEHGFYLAWDGISYQIYVRS